jgi:sporulation-control protein spo0M
VEADFGAEGEPAKKVTYRAKVMARGSEAEIRELMNQTDRVAEIQNTLRVETPVTFGDIQVVVVDGPGVLR